MDHSKKVQGLRAFWKMLPIFWQFNSMTPVAGTLGSAVVVAIASYFTSGLIAVSAYIFIAAALIIVVAILSQAWMNLIQVNSPRVYSKTSACTDYKGKRTYRIEFFGDEDVTIITIVVGLEKKPIHFERLNGMYFIKKYSVTGESIVSYVEHLQQNTIEKNGELFLTIDENDIELRDPADSVLLKCNNFHYYKLWHGASLKSNAQAFISLVK